MLQINVYIHFKTLSNGIRIRKRSFKNQEPRKPDLIIRGDYRETIKVIKILRDKCSPGTGIAKEIVMGHNRRCFLVRHGDHH